MYFLSPFGRRFHMLDACRCVHSIERTYIIRWNNAFEQIVRRSIAVDPSYRIAARAIEQLKYYFSYVGRKYGVAASISLVSLALYSQQTTFINFIQICNKTIGSMSFSFVFSTELNCDKVTENGEQTLCAIHE